MKTQEERVVDTLFLIALAVTVIGLLITIYLSGKGEEVTQDPTTAITIGETIETISESTQNGIVATEATEPATRLYDVPLEEDLQIHIINLCEEKHIDPAIVMAMAYKESSYRTNAIGDGGKSYGLMQVQPRWHYERMQKLGCTDLLDPYQNVTVAVDYLAEKLDNNGGDLAKALTAYNNGHFPGYVTQYARSVMATAEGLRGETYAVYQN